jgi:hypothetical protein
MSIQVECPRDVSKAARPSIRPSGLQPTVIPPSSQYSVSLCISVTIMMPKRIQLRCRVQARGFVSTRCVFQLSRPPLMGSESSLIRSLKIIRYWRNGLG